MIKTDEAIIKIVSRLELMYGNAIDMYKTKELLEEVLYDYDIVDKEKGLMVINNDIQQKLYLFLASKKIDGLSDCSLKSYRLHLRRFAGTMNKNVADIDAMDIRIYLANYAKTGVKKNSIATEQSILRSFFGWLEINGCIDKSPMRLIKQIKVEKRIRKALTKEEFEIFLKGAKTPREIALALVFYATGSRLDELVKLNRSDINWSDLSMIVDGKGSKERIVYLNARAKVYLKQYLDTRADDCEALFVTKVQPIHRLGKRSVEREIKRIAENSELSKDVFCHLLRHTTAQHLMNSGMSATVLQKYLGHTSPATTLIYADISNNEVEHQYKKYSI